MRSIKAILFDFDGVIAETFPSHFAAWKLVLAELNFCPDENTIRIHEGFTTTKIAQALFTRNGMTINDETARRYAEKKNLVFQKHHTAKIYPGIHDLLPALKRHFKLGLVSGSTLKNIQSVVPAHLLNLFNVIIKDGDTEHSKPDPEPYVMAAKKLGILPQECIVIENAPLGIQAAKSAGTFCIGLVTTLPAAALSDADMLCESHEELFQKIASITGV
jgi:beta-phosphoglucomutase